VKSISNSVFLLAALAPGLALAQANAASNVTVYGRLDVAVDSTRFSATSRGPSSSARYVSNDTSYWGIAGSEQLGGGAKAYFKLENGFSLDTGALGSTTSFFNREAYVGLGNSMGSLQLGSQYAPAFWITAKVDPFQRSANAPIFTLMQQNGANKQRGYRLVQDNAIQYVSPQFNGVTVRAMYGLSERTVAPKDLGAFKSVGAEYGQGAFYAGVSYEDEKVATVPAGDAISKKTYTAGATYDFRVAKLHGYALQNTLAGSPNARGYLAGLTFPLGRGTIRTSYSTRKLVDTAGSKATVMGLGYTYDLSKRTILYTSYARVNNDSAANFGLWPSSKTYGPAPSSLPVAGQDINSVEVGIRHFF
jgi:predicted porin